MGEFIVYDVKNINGSSDTSLVYIDSLTLKSDTFLTSYLYLNYEEFKETKLRIFDFVSLGIPLSLNESEIEDYVLNNPESYITYLTLGDYFFEKGNLKKAKVNYEMALSKDVASLNEEKLIKDKISKCLK